MKFLISDYSTPWHTEPYYFNAGLNLVGQESNILNHNVSMYDNFDRFTPDIYITHISQLSKDVIRYITENKKIKLLINTNFANPDLVKKNDEYLISSKIDYSFFGNNSPDNMTKYVKILFGADIFLNRQKKQYNISKLIFIESKNQIEKLDGTYHYTATNQEMIENVDIIFPSTTLSLLFNSYDEIIFKGSSYIGSQVAFDAIYSGTKVIFDTKEAKDLDKIDEIFKKQKLLTSVKNKHTCLHRLKSLMSQVSCEDIAQKVENKIGEI